MSKVQNKMNLLLESPLKYLFIVMLISGCFREYESEIMNTDFIFESPENIRLGSQYNTLRGVTLSWNSPDVNDRLHWGYTKLCEQEQIQPQIHAVDDEYTFEAPFPVLQADKNVYYRIETQGQKTEVKNFMSAHDTSSSHFSFLVGGDSHAGRSSNSNQRWQSISTLMAAEEAQFFIHLGDMVHRKDNWDHWEQYFTNGQTLLEQTLTFYTWGNHDYSDLGVQNVSLPGNKKWYSFEQGNTLFICLLSEAEPEAQHQWLDTVLQNADHEWIIVYFHRPFFTCGPHKDEMNALRKSWWRSFDDHGVDVVMSGHTHSYIRSKPINLAFGENSIAKAYGSSEDRGRLSLVSGGLGGHITDEAENWFVEKSADTWHYMLFQIDDAQLHLRTYSHTGELLDSVTLFSQY